MQKTLLIIAGLLFALLVLFYAWRFLCSGEGHRSPEELVQVALESTDPAEQEEAVLELIELGGPALKHLQRVLAESQTDRVRAAAIQGLAFQRDYDSMPILLDAMADPSLVIRVRAGAAVQKLLGVKVDFHASAPPEEREKAAAILRKEWERMRSLPNFEEFKKQQQSQL
jgi:HEAT repeat protein